ncbi:hypothetical protein Indivirus_1_207 [Indivirus ILV1]|uniref:Uncharacterized protein n=1 Tax=Indivirus ILV1 TaxID=1977633 RepID=A0A1V0SD77_9VIRU|nr:hypothetical protein Indivirus_1_207 [Indivirus ILV1]
MNVIDITLSDMEMTEKKTCNLRVNKPIIQTGGWDPHTQVGIIMAHGRQRINKFIVIPEGMHIRTMSNSGGSPNTGEFIQNTDLDTPTNRHKIWDKELTGVGGRIHGPGEIIGDLTLEFRVTWDQNPGLIYANTGVYTEGQINVKIRDGSGLSEEDLKKASMNKTHNDNDIINPDVAWGKSETLGSIIKNIVKAKKKGRYILQACRAGNLINNVPESCGKESHDQLKRSVTSIYQNFHNKLKEIIASINDKGYLGAITSDDTQMYTGNPLIKLQKKQYFVSEFTTYIKSRIGPLNDFTLDLEELCDFAELYDNKFISSKMINRYINDGFFEKFNKMYYMN